MGASRRGAGRSEQGPVGHGTRGGERTRRAGRQVRGIPDAPPRGPGAEGERARWRGGEGEGRPPGERGLRGGRAVRAPGSQQSAAGGQRSAQQGRGTRSRGGGRAKQGGATKGRMAPGLLAGHAPPRLRHAPGPALCVPTQLPQTRPFPPWPLPWSAAGTPNPNCSETPCRPLPPPPAWPRPQRTTRPVPPPGPRLRPEGARRERPLRSAARTRTPTRSPAPKRG